MNFEQRKQQIFSRVTAEQIIAHDVEKWNDHITSRVFSSRKIKLETAQKRLNALSAAQREDVIAQYAMRSGI